MTAPAQANRLIIHCGVQKTGSTAFHHFVQRNRAALAPFVKILTPAKGTPVRELGRQCALFSLNASHRDAVAAQIGEIKRGLDAGQGPWIVSHENIPGAMLGREGVVTLYPALERILELLDRHFAPLLPEFAFYTRRMEGWKVSVHNQAVKSDRYQEPLDAFLASTADCGSWDSLRERAEALAGPERVHFFALEDEPGRGRPGSQLLQFAGVPQEVLAALPAQDGRRNESLNAGALEFLRLVNALSLPRGARHPLARLIRQNQALFVAEGGQP